MQSAALAFDAGSKDGWSILAQSPRMVPIVAGFCPCHRTASVSGTAPYRHEFLGERLARRFSGRLLKPTLQPREHPGERSKHSANSLRDGPIANNHAVFSALPAHPTPSASPCLFLGSRIALWPCASALPSKTTPATIPWESPGQTPTRGALRGVARKPGSARATRAATVPPALACLSGGAEQRSFDFCHRALCLRAWLVPASGE